jgi:hypothetical protein
VIPASFLQDLLTRVDIVEVVGRHVELKKAGINHKGLCPFHGEKTPSFIVSPSRQTYHCFGCGAHGDAIRFLTEQGGLSFPDAVRELAQQVGMTVPEENVDPAERERAAQARAHQTTLVDVLDKAAAHYRTQLKASPRAIDYLKRRGLTGQVAARFALGYAPEGWRSLASAFARYDDPLLAESGLVIVQGDDGDEQKRYDRFRDRIMFPIRSVKGEVIGFGGRVIDAGEPKYLNSPETPVFSKGRELYGLFEARQAIRERGCALVVEGYMDVVALAQQLPGSRHPVLVLLGREVQPHELGSPRHGRGRGSVVGNLALDADAKQPPTDRPVERVAHVRAAAVVPHDDVAVAPRVAIHELRPRHVRPQASEQPIALRHAAALDVAVADATEEQRVAAGLRVRADDRVVPAG